METQPGKVLLEEQAQRRGSPFLVLRAGESTNIAELLQKLCARKVVDSNVRMFVDASSTLPGKKKKSVVDTFCCAFGVREATTSTSSDSTTRKHAAEEKRLPTTSLSNDRQERTPADLRSLSI